MNRTKKPTTAGATARDKESKKKLASGEIESVLTRSKELEDMLKRTLADYQNLERRIEEERRMLSKLSSLLLIEKLLPILDNLESAQMHINDEGLELVIKQFKEVLSSEGISEIQADGQTFDPNLHEAIEIQEGQEDNKIVKVINKGYKIDDKVIRPAKVVVVRKNVQKQSDEKAQEAIEFGDYA